MSPPRRPRPAGGGGDGLDIRAEAGFLRGMRCDLAARAALLPCALIFALATPALAAPGRATDDDVDLPAKHDHESRPGHEGLDALEYPRFGAEAFLWMKIGRAHV